MENQIKRTDFNLLKLFVVLMETRSVSASAEELNITQSATSHALRRLREAFSDNLFIVTKDGMVPTPKALNIKPIVEEAVRLIELSLRTAQEFDSMSCERHFVLVASEYFEVVVFPELVKLFFERAPRCSIEVKKLKPEMPHKELQSGSVDLVIAFQDFFKPDNALVEEVLLSDRLICVLGNENAEVGDKISMDQYLTMTHIYPSPWGHQKNMVDDWLKSKNLQRNVGVTVNNYLATSMVTENTNFLLTLPERTFQAVKNNARIRMVEPPCDDYPCFSMNMIYHRLFEDDAASLWLRGLLRQACKEIQK